jgi:hypothetical protein
MAAAIQSAARAGAFAHAPRSAGAPLQIRKNELMAETRPNRTTPVN